MLHQTTSVRADLSKNLNVDTDGLLRNTVDCLNNDKNDSIECKLERAHQENRKNRMKFMHLYQLEKYFK